MVKKIFLSILFIILVVGGFLAYTLFRPAIRTGANKEMFFYIHTGESLSSVKSDLIDQQIISGNGFGLTSKILKYKSVKPGRYKLKKGMSLFSLIKMLRNGNQSIVKMVIIKERTREAFAGKFGKGKKFDSETDSIAMIRFLTNNDTLARYGADTNSVMGFIMPYTYEVAWNSSPGKIFRQFFQAHKQFWNTERKAKADSLQLSPEQVTTLASIVEEETNKKEDKYKIASTYLNRLRLGMRLQADPTIKYALKDFKLGRITGKLLDIVSPYNTYMNAGLPPGPICTPSIESLEAVLNAPSTDYIYFVASDKFDGSSVFASNLADHQKNAKLYQQELNRRIDSVRKSKTTE